MEFVNFTTSEGEDIIVNPGNVAYVRVNNEKANACILMFNKEFGISVQGSLLEVHDLLYSKRS